MRIIIELPTWLGDCVMCSPAIINILKAYPNSEIIFIGSNMTIALFERHPNFYKSFTYHKKYLDVFFLSKKLGNADIFFSFRSSIRSTFLKFLVKSKSKFQFNKKFYAHGHQVEKYNNFVNHSLNTEYKPGKLKLFNQKKDIDKALPKKYIGINPGASYGSAKCWELESYADVAKELSNEYPIVILGGEKEALVAEKLELLFKRLNITNYLNLCGKTSIDELISIIGKMEILITGDSGTMHIAGAMEIKIIALFGPTKSYETSVWKAKHYKIIKKNLDCQPCMKRECPLLHNNCMRLIKPKEVLAAISEIRD